MARHVQDLLPRKSSNQLAINARCPHAKASSWQCGKEFMAWTKGTPDYHTETQSVAKKHTKSSQGTELTQKPLHRTISLPRLMAKMQYTWRSLGWWHQLNPKNTIPKQTPKDAKLHPSFGSCAKLIRSPHFLLTQAWNRSRTQIWILKWWEHRIRSFTYMTVTGDQLNQMNCKINDSFLAPNFQPGKYTMRHQLGTSKTWDIWIQPFKAGSSLWRRRQEIRPLVIPEVGKTKENPLSKIFTSRKNIHITIPKKMYITSLKGSYSSKWQSLQGLIIGLI